MAPLVPDVIGYELNMIVAFLLGICFGFILEQAGFSSSRRLAGLFYGYDFVVLRVFFTAALTAMGGVVILSWLGLLDVDLVYVNPTFLQSAILGGVIMGAGFIIGGYCPGTSFCAAAIGKTDAMVFIGGILLGVFLFSEGFPLWSELYTAGDLGAPLVFDSLGLSRGLFAFLLTFAALAAFAVTGLIERRVRGAAVSPPWANWRYSLLTGLALLLGFFMIFMPEYKTRAREMASPERWQDHCEVVRPMAAEELADLLVKRDARLLLVDLRGEDAFHADHIPGAVNIPFESLSEPRWRELLGAETRTKVFYGEDVETAGRACVMSSALGDGGQVRLLAGGMEAFRALLDEGAGYRPPNERYRAEAFYGNLGAELEKLRAEEKPREIVPPKRRKVQGGC